MAALVALLVLMSLVALASPSSGMICYIAWKMVRPQEFLVRLGTAFPVERIFAIVLILSALFHLKLLKPRPLVSDRQNWALLAFLGVNYISAVGSLSIGQTVVAANAFVTTVLFYFLMINLLYTAGRL